MPPIIRSVLAVLAGGLVGVLVVSGMDSLVGRAYPLPAGTDPDDPFSLAQGIAAMSLPPLLLMLTGWVIAAGAGSYLAARLAGRAPLPHGLVVTALLLLATVANLMAIPHPTWMWPGAIILIPLAGWVAGRLVPAPRAAAQPAVEQTSATR